MIDKWNSKFKKNDNIFVIKDCIKWIVKIDFKCKNLRVRDSGG